MKTQFLVKSRLGIISHCSTFSFFNLITRSVVLATGNALFNVTAHFWTKCLCNADTDIDKPRKFWQSLSLISSTAVGCMSMYSIRNCEYASVNFLRCLTLGLL